ncbi:MAG: UvrABC system protein C [Phycisphaerae bacterium]|nr:UvrABC system protein C [Phycisphaerae bacterium]
MSFPIARDIPYDGRMAAYLSTLFDLCLPLDPGDAAAVEGQLRAVPDKPAVYLLATEDDRPVLLASGLAVRSILRRRLGEPITEDAGGGDRGAGVGGEKQGVHDARLRRSRRADLRPIVRRLHLKATYSAFENDLWYLWIARALYPQSYHGLIRPRYCWMVHADPAEPFPRIAMTARFDPAAGRRVGPLPDKHAANRLCDLLVDLFDLCRYPHILAQAPGGTACAYKEMGRCPAPCDGSEPMAGYRRRVAEAMAFAADAAERARWQGGRAAAMAAASAALDFELAARIKAHLARGREFDSPKHRWLSDAEALDFLIVQPGHKKPELRTFRALAGRLREGPRLLRSAPARGLAAWSRLVAPPPDAAARADEAGLLADYLFKFKSEEDRGLFLRYQGQSTAELAAAVAEAFPPTRRSRKADPLQTGPADSPPA